MISTLINTGCGRWLVRRDLMNRIILSQTSEAISLYTLRYHSIGFDRFFWLWSFLHVVFPKRLFIIRCLHSKKCNNLRDRGNPYKLPDLWPLNSPDLSPINNKIWGIIQQREGFDIATAWCVGWSGRQHYSRCYWPSAHVSQYCIQP